MGEVHCTEGGSIKQWYCLSIAVAFVFDLVVYGFEICFM